MITLFAARTRIIERVRHMFLVTSGKLSFTYKIPAGLKISGCYDVHGVLCAFENSFLHQRPFLSIGKANWAESCDGNLTKTTKWSYALMELND